MVTGGQIAIFAISMFFLSVLPPLTHFLRCRKRIKHSTPTQSNFNPEVTVLLPVRNESQVIIRKLNEITSMDYDSAKLRIIIVDSSSDEKTRIAALEFLNSSRCEIPFEIISMEKPGKSRAINRSLEEIKTDFFIMMDAESQCPSDSISKVISRFSDPEIGAVCGSLDISENDTEFPYRSRYNSIRIGESIIDSTPIFEGSICAFRMSSIGSSRINSNINADDSQMAILVRINGFRAIMDQEVIFFDKQPFFRQRSVRRAQGLSRTLAANWRLSFGLGSYSKIFRQALYFYSIFPWLIAISTSLSIVSMFIIISNNPIDGNSFKLFTINLVHLSLLFSNSGRGLIGGSTILLESHIRLLMGQKMQIWDPSKRPQTEL
jgi:cellulose synthase/poly-beta-1,6-N-acetylglucosamine synthase-like glycosyltransferase